MISALRVKLRNAARSDKAFLSLCTRDDKTQQLEKGVCIRVLIGVLKRVSTLWKEDNTAIDFLVGRFVFVEISVYLSVIHY